MQEKLFYVFFVCCLFISLINGDINVYPWSKSIMKDRNNMKHLLQEYGELKGLLGTLVETKSTKGKLKALSVNHEVQSDCLNDTLVIIEGILRKDMAAIAFFDADFKPESGILDGNIAWMGDYSECISLKLDNPYTKMIIEGKYFSVLLKPPKLIPTIPGLAVGICLPKTCNESDAKNLLSLALSPETPPELSSVQMVYDVSKPTITSGAIGAIIVIIFIGITVAIGTSVDVFDSVYGRGESVIPNGDIFKTDEEKNSVPNENTHLLNETVRLNVSNGKTNGGLFRIAKAFSIFENTKKLMNTNTANSPLACLNGLRVISICWVIQGHSYEFSRSFLSNNIYFLSTLTKRFTFQPILNGTFSVDTFFFMSGLLVAYLTLKEMKAKGRLNWFYYFGHRFWRLTPMYAFLLLVFATLTPFLISGPFRWTFTEPKGPFYPVCHKCEDYWWSNLIYINNLYPDYGSLQGCMAWTWYLANDMQFYIFIAPVVLLLLYKVKVIGIIFSSLLILACVSIRGGLAAHYGMNQFASPSAHLDSPWVKNGPIYQYPFTRWSTYVVGLLTGYILHKSNCRVKMNKLISSIGWIISIACALSVVYGLYYYRHNPGTNASTFGSRLYVATSRTVWSFSLAWLVIACASGYGGWVNNILSWKLWAPMGRLTYAAYLIHPIVLVVFLGNQITTFMYTDSMLVYIFIGSLVITYGLSYIVSMLVEAPMMQLEKIILNR